jgi:predicted Zn finger-like uncharacterized protein
VFTQCPECSTVFRVTATVLRAAQGQVRCGVCDANFDALRFLTDAVEGEVPAPSPPAPAAPPPPAAVVEPPPAAQPAPPPPPRAAPAAAPPASPPAATRTTPSADEDRELAMIAAALARDAHAQQVRARDRQPPPPPPTAPAPAAAEDELVESDDVNILEPRDVENIVLGTADPETAEPSLEFNVPPGEWDRVFVADPHADTITPLDINLGNLGEASLNAADEMDAAEELLTLIDTPVQSSPAADIRARGEEDSLSRTDEHARLEPELKGTREEPDEREELEPVEVEADANATAPPLNVEDAWFDAAIAPADVAPAPAALAVHAPAASLGDEEPLFALPPEDPVFATKPARSAPRSRRSAMAAGIAALALVLIGQLIHHNRESLASSEPVGGVLRALYARLGHPIEPHWDLGAYDVKQWGAASDNAPGSLRLRASVVNRGARAQPYPLLRVTLEDRFGAKVARGEFTPAEYLPGHVTPTGLLAPGARADADLLLADPGSQAVGFELDVCLMRLGAVSCGTEPRTAGTG